MPDASLLFVGMTRFELATPRPPDAYSNRAELHPEQSVLPFESGCKGKPYVANRQTFSEKNCAFAKNFSFS